MLGIVLLVCGMILGYTWLGYPSSLWILRRIRKYSVAQQACQPMISIIVAVHNEESHIRSKLDDCLALEYPRERLEIILASDGSTDGTEQMVQEFSSRDRRIRLVRTQGRAGKSGAQNLAAEHATGELLLFTDAETSTQPNLLNQIAEDFADPRVGLVAPIVHFGKLGTAVSDGQGAYWRFELLLRQLESDIGILATVSGSAFAIRKHLFRPIPPQYGDDCIVPLDVRLQGYRVIQDARAIVFDTMPHTVEGEMRARVRMTARNWTGILSRPGVLNPLRFPGTAWGLVSHKFLRWLTPLFLIVLFAASGLLAAQGRYMPLFALHSCFYLAAFIGWRRSHGRECERIFAYPFAFCLANVGFLLGTLRCLRGATIVTYK